jgi:hypothetical protein
VQRQRRDCRPRHRAGQCSLWQAHAQERRCSPTPPSDGSVATAPLARRNTAAQPLGALHFPTPLLGTPWLHVGPRRHAS